MQEVDYYEKYLETRTENIQLRYALRSLIDAYNRQIESGSEVLEFTPTEIERIKAVKSIL